MSNLMFFTEIYLFQYLKEKYFTEMLPLTDASHR